jgi:DNA replication protein DnaC
MTNSNKCKKHNIEYAVNETIITGFNKPVKSYTCAMCEEEEKARQAKIEIEKAKRNDIMADMPELFKKAKISDFTNIGPILNWVKNPEGFLFIHGKCGTGKSYLSAAIIRELRLNKNQAKYFTSTQISIKLRNSFKDENSEQEVIYDIAGVEKFVNYQFGHVEETSPTIHFFDDMGSSKLSEYVLETWFFILDYRYSNKLPTVLNSNYTLKEISNIMSDRIASRIASGVVYELKGTDRRIA